MSVAVRRGEIYDHYQSYVPIRGIAAEPIYHHYPAYEHAQKNAARALHPLPEYDVYHTHEAPGPRLKKKTEKKGAPREKKQVYVHLNTKDGKLSLLTLGSIFYIFLGVLVCLMLYAVTLSKHEDILSSQNDLKHLKEYNAYLSANISSSYDLNEIEKIAVTKLEMSEPKPHQIIHIRVPKQSYAVRNEEPKTTALEGDNSFISALKDIFAKD